MDSLLFFLRVGVGVVVWTLVSTLFSIAAVLTWGSPTMASRYARTMSRITLWILGVEVRVEGGEKLDDAKPCLYVPNHQSNLDFLFIGYIFPTHTSCIGKRELAFFPIFGLLFAATRNIFIDRKDRASSIALLDKAVSAMRTRGDSIWIFPEGTRNKTGEPLGPFKKGAFHMAIAAQRPLQPLVTSRVDSHVDLKKKRLFGGTFVIRVLDPIPTEGLTVADIDALMARTHEVMRAAIVELNAQPSPYLQPTSARLQ